MAFYPSFPLFRRALFRAVNAGASAVLRSLTTKKLRYISYSAGLNPLLFPALQHTPAILLLYAGNSFIPLSLKYGHINYKCISVHLYGPEYPLLDI